MTDSHPFLSIIIPIFNVEKYLPECLESILSQDSTKLEIILVDDGSSDGSLLVAQSYIDRFKACVLVQHSENKGLGPARNTGISASTGTYILFLDSDDYLEPAAINKIMELAFSLHIDLIQFGCNKVYQDRTEQNLYLPKQDISELSLLQKKRLILSIPSYAWMKLYRRDFILENDLKFENIFYEDIPWSIKCNLLAKDIYWAPYALYNYRQRSGSIVNSISEKHYDMLKAYKSIYTQIEKEGVPFRLKRSIDNGFAKSAYYFHLQREKRIGKLNENRFFSHLTEVRAQSWILPDEFRAQIMWCVLLWKNFVFRVKSLFSAS